MYSFNVLDHLLTLSHQSTASLRVNKIDEVNRSFLIYTQGNPLSKDHYSDIKGGYDISIKDLINLITLKGMITEVEVIGGEPYIQAANLGFLAEKLRNTGITIKVNSYFDEGEIEKAAQYNRHIKKLYKNSVFKGKEGKKRNLEGYYSSSKELFKY